MKQNATILLLILIIFTSCNNNPEATNNETNADSSKSASPLIKEKEEIEITTEEINFPEASCLNWEIYETGPDGDTGFESDCAPIDGTIHLLSDSDDHLEGLKTLVSGYYFSKITKKNGEEKYNNMTTKVIGYYPNGRKMIEVDIEKGNRSGLYIVSNEAGKVQVYRDYSNKKVNSRKELYNNKWTFDTNTVVLDIDVNDFETIKGQKVYSLTFTNSDQNLFYKKSIWDNAPLTIGGQPFSGILRGYNDDIRYSDNKLKSFQIFEIEFKNGLMHGRFNIWDDMMGHMLEEVFEKGEWKETLFKLNPEDMEGMAKPVIYLYPKKEQAINVKLNLKGKIVHPYPRYNKEEGWNVIAKPNGELKDIQSGKDFYCLYWEGLTPHHFDLSTGFVVKGSESIEFLEEKLELLGLNRREANEMIIYWLPRLEKNPYNLIHFSTKEYNRIAQLKITPKPDHLIRLMMVFKALDTPISIKEQVLVDYTEGRKGFTVVEWGGQEVKKNQVSIIY